MGGDFAGSICQLLANEGSPVEHGLKERFYDAVAVAVMCGGRFMNIRGSVGRAGVSHRVTS